MIGLAASLGVASVVVDSSGNAGRAAAAAASACGLACTVYLPGGGDRAKVEAIAAHRAVVVEVPGGRSAAARAARDAVGRGEGWYASHAHQPAFHHGVKTLALELADQLGPGALAASTLVVPAGNGTLVLGLWIGLRELGIRARLVAVQAERCAPLAGRPVDPGGPATAAAGIAVADPPRAAQVRAAVAASGGRVVTVAEEAIRSATGRLRAGGYPVEPTGAVALAGATGLPGPGPVVVVLTGRML